MPVLQHIGFYNDEWVASHLPKAHAGGLHFSDSPRLITLNCGTYAPPVNKTEPFGVTGTRRDLWCENEVWVMASLIHMASGYKS